MNTINKSLLLLLVLSASGLFAAEAGSNDFINKEGIEKIINQINIAKNNAINNLDNKRHDKNVTIVSEINNKLAEIENLLNPITTLEFINYATVNNLPNEKQMQINAILDLIANEFSQDFSYEKDQLKNQLIYLTQEKNNNFTKINRNIELAFEFLSRQIDALIIHAEHIKEIIKQQSSKKK